MAGLVKMTGLPDMPFKYGPKAWFSMILAGQEDSPSR
jgi:hypothetical protein